MAFSGIAFADTLPEEATVTVRPFTFPQEALSGAEEDAEKYAIDFRNQLVLACQKVGYIVTKDKNVAHEEEEEKTEEVAKEEEAKEDENTSEEVSEGTSESASEDKDELMDAVEKAEQEEKNQEENALDEKVKTVKKRPKEMIYVVTGYVTEYEGQVGKVVNVGNSQRQKLNVVFSTNFKVKDASGKTIVSDKVSVSSSSVVSQSQDADDVLRKLNKKAFAEASRQIVQKMSGQSDKEEENDAISDDDYYNDSPGKRLKGDKPRTEAKTTNLAKSKKSSQSKSVQAKSVQLRYSEKAIQTASTTPPKKTSPQPRGDGPVTFERDGKVVTKWTIH